MDPPESKFSISADTKTAQIITTVPDVIQRHNISDEELEMLCESKRDFVLEFLWIAIGVLLGSLPAAFAAISRYLESESKMPTDDLIQIVLFFSAMFMTATLGVVAHKREKRSKSLQTQIRDRSPGSITNQS